MVTLFVYEIDGEDNWFIMKKDKPGHYASFKCIGKDLDYDSVAATLSATVGSFTFSASYDELKRAIVSFCKEFSTHKAYMSASPETRTQVDNAGYYLRSMKSQEQKIREKNRRKVYDEREKCCTKMRRGEFGACDFYGAKASIGKIIDAYLEDYKNTMF